MDRGYGRTWRYSGRQTPCILPLARSLACSETRATRSFASCRLPCTKTANRIPSIHPTHLHEPNRHHKLRRKSGKVGRTGGRDGPKGTEPGQSGVAGKVSSGGGPSVVVLPILSLPAMHLFCIFCKFLRGTTFQARSAERQGPDAATIRARPETKRLVSSGCGRALPVRYSTASWGDFGHIYCRGRINL